MKNSIALLLFLFILLLSCKNDKKEPVLDNSSEEYTTVKLSAIRPNLNISILLDFLNLINEKGQAIIILLLNTTIKL